VAEDLSWVPAGVDTGKASIARVYDYWLGGTHNLQADRDAARALMALEPNAREITRANRQALARAVRYLAGTGISQFIDIGSGIPTQGNVHEVAQAAVPGARVLYADVDPVAVAHSRAILAGNPGASAIQADLREPAAILAHPQAQRLIDFSRPVGLLLIAVLHFLADDDGPWQVVATLRDALAPGSHLVISHALRGGRMDADLAEKAYRQRVDARVSLRSRPEIERFFDGFSMVDPGVVYLPQWRPDSAADVPDDPASIWWLAGAGRKA